MMKLIVVLAALGFALVFAATAILAWLNWGPRLYTPVITSLLIGISTGLVSIALPLKPSHSVRSFATGVVVFRDRIGAPIALPQSHAALSRLDVSPLLNQMPASERTTSDLDAVMNTSLEATQYALVKLIRDIEGGGWSTGIVDGVSSATVRASPPTKVVPIDAEILASAISTNRFAALPTEGFFWSHLRFSLPPGTYIELYHTPSSPTTGVEQRGVRFVKPRFFRIDLQVQPLGLDGGLPSGLEVAASDRPHVGTLQLAIKATIDFDRLTAGNQKTDEYKRWADWLVDEIASRIGGV